MNLESGKHKTRRGDDIEGGQDWGLTGRGRDRQETWRVVRAAVLRADRDVAVVPAHEQDLVAGLYRSSAGIERVCRVGRIRVPVRRRREKRNGVAGLDRKCRLKRIPRRRLRAEAALSRCLAVHRIEVPDVIERRRRDGAAWVDLYRVGAAAKDGGHAESAGRAGEAQLVQNHGGLSRRSHGSGNVSMVARLSSRYGAASQRRSGASPP